MDTKNRRYRNARTGKVETAHQIGYAVQQDSWDSAPSRIDGTQPADETPREDLIAQGNDIAQDDPEYKEL